MTRWWVWLHLLSIAALVWQPSSPAVILGRYSRNSALFAAMLLALLPAVMWAARWLPRQRRPLFPAWLVLGGAALFVGCLWGVPAASAVPYKVIRLYMTFAAFTLAMWLTEEQAPLSPNLAPILTALSLVMVVGVAFRFPGVLWTDEGYMISAALGFNQTGAPVPLYWLPYESSSFSLAYMGLGAWLNVFGVSHTAARLFILLLGLVTVSITAYAVRLAYRDSFAMWGAVIAGLFALSYLNVLRQDILSALFLSVGLVLYLLAEKRVWLHLLVGFFVGFSIDGHPLAYRLGLGFGVAYAVEYALLVWRERRWFWPPFYLLAAGGLAAVGTYLLFYSTIAPSLGGYTTSSPFILSVSPSRFSEQFEIALQNIPVLVGLAGFGAVIALRRNTRLDRLLLIVSAVGVLVLSTLYPIYRSYYQAHTLPLLMLLAALALHVLPRTARPAAVLLITVAGAGYVLRGAILNAQDYRPALRVADELREVVPPDTRFAGVDPFYHRMYDYDFFEQQALLLLAGQQGITPEGAWEIVAPEAIAVVSAYPLPPPPGLLAYIEANAMVRTHCWEVDPLGTVDLYLMDGTLVGQCRNLTE